jgi:pyridoxine 4-dehydrogenase
MYRYGILGHGLLGGNIASLSDLPEKDYRKIFPRFQEEHFNKNVALVEEVKRLAEEKRCTQAQLAIAWVLTVSKRSDMPTIVPIPGSSSVERIKENAAAADVVLTGDDMQRIDAIVKKYGVSGDRYHAHGMDTLDT